MDATDQRYVRIELSEKTIARLLAGGQICVAELRCLDCRTKRCIWRLVLESCRADMRARCRSGSVHKWFHPIQLNQRSAKSETGPGAKVFKKPHGQAIVDTSRGFRRTADGVDR
jgi:hypothetical protein